MKTWKQPTLLSRNSSELNGAIMILETNKLEGEDYLFYFYKTNEKSSSFQKIKSILLAASQISNNLFYDNPRIITYSYKNHSYKSTAKIYLKKYLVYVVLPAIAQDNIIMFICDEFIQFCNLFFENFEDSKKFTNILDKYAEILFYLTSNYSLPSQKEDIIGTPISLLPIMNMTFSYNEIIPIFMIKPGLSDTLRADLIEHLNSLNSDRSVLQETLTLMEPPFYLKGYILLYRGFVVFNTLNNKEMANGARLAMLHEMYMRSQSSPEILSCEFLFDTPTFNYNCNYFNNNDNNNNNCINKKKTLTTLLAQREFVMLISLEILGKNNCTFDPFYHKRAEDLLVNLLKKSFSSIISNELFDNSIKMSNIENINKDFDDNNKNSNNDKDDFLKNINTNFKNGKNRESSSSNKSNNNSMLNNSIINLNKKNEQTLSTINNIIKGYIDPETNINIIHFSCYDDTECVINTTDLNVTLKMYKDIYRYIFNLYAKIQSNINKLKLRNKRIKLNNIFSCDNLKSENLWKKENLVKTKITHDNLIRSLSNFPGEKLFKINEYGVKLINDLSIPIWVCCKIYEHITFEDDINMDEYSNYKIIFVAYESQIPVDIDSFCQDLLMNELFI